MNIYRFLADVVLLLHFAYVTFVIGGMVAILLGIVLHWPWVRNFWFRTVHLAAIALVVLQSVLGVLCPLTVLENRLREAGGAPNEPGWFLGRWIERLLFVDLSTTALAIGYMVFGAAVLVAFILAPPRWPRKNEH